MKRFSILVMTILSIFLCSAMVLAFCGFYVAKADTKLFNKASQVVIARHDNKTIITMSNDFRGELQEFAMVIPVPSILEKSQIHVGERAVLDHLDVYSSPRLVEYFDEDPCRKIKMDLRLGDAQSMMESMPSIKRRQKGGVIIEARYTIGEYDILILSAEESDGLERWLIENNYKVPTGASDVLEGYIEQGMKFFVARVNLKEQNRLGFKTLRPLQVAFESPKFMLPIRLGMVNADGPQELFIYTLTKKGRVETTNYRTVKLPTNLGLPVFIKKEFGDFYKALFSEQVKKENMKTLFLEYAWDMAWCDPCVADPLSHAALRKLGVFWLGDGKSLGRGNPPPQVFLTRLHVRYDAEHFPEDLVFQETEDRQNFQARYILRHPWQGDAACVAAVSYREKLLNREAQEAQRLANLTAWDIHDIRKKVGITGITGIIKKKKWYEKLWGGGG